MIFKRIKIIKSPCFHFRACDVNVQMKVSVVYGLHFLSWFMMAANAAPQIQSSANTRVRLRIWSHVRASGFSRARVRVWVRSFDFVRLRSFKFIFLDDRSAVSSSRKKLTCENLKRYQLMTHIISAFWRVEMKLIRVKVKLASTLDFNWRKAIREVTIFISGKVHGLKNIEK